MVEMPNLLREQMAYLKHTATGRKFFVSYPKSGRTWIFNVLMNYWYRTYEDVSDPMPFVRASKDPRLLHVHKQSGVTFSHGGKIKRLLNGDFSEFNRMVLRNLNVVLLVRHPIDTLVSFYHHMSHTRSELKGIEPEEFLYGDLGIDPIVRYYNFLMPNILQNEKSLVVTYESLHPSGPDHMFRVAQLFFHMFGTVDYESLQWAYDVCRIENLKMRSETPTKRIRSGAVGAATRGEISDSAAGKAIDYFFSELDEDVSAFFQSCYGTGSFGSS